MLVLTRKRNERILIEDVVTGERMELSILEIRGDKVRIGFDASPEWRIWRSELGSEFRRGAMPVDCPSPESPAPSPQP